MKPYPESEIPAEFRANWIFVDWILENHHPEPLTDAQQAEFKRILQAAERELG